MLSNWLQLSISYSQILFAAVFLSLLLGLFLLIFLCFFRFISSITVASTIAKLHTKDVVSAKFINVVHMIAYLPKILNGFFVLRKLV